MLDHSGGTVEGMNCLRPLEHWDREFESHSRHGCVCAVLCVGSGLATGWSSVQGVLPTVYKIRELKKWPRSIRAVDIDGQTDNFCKWKSVNYSLTDIHGWQ
jgi:hypothetical protein